MNSVFSAFKGNKSDKQKNSLIGGKKINSVQDSSYENLRQIREIGSSTKMMTSMVNDDVDEDLLNLHKRPIIPAAVINENDCLLSVDVVDHAAPSSPNNCNLLDSSRVTLVSLKENETTQIQSNNATSTAATSPLISNATTGNSRCSSSCSNSSSTSCELTTIVASPEADSSNNSISSPTTVETSPSPVSGSTPTNPMNNNDDPYDSSISSSTSDTKVNNAGLITDNPTQPIIMALSRGSMNSKNNSKSTPQINTLPNSATTTPKSARYSKPRLSLSGFTNNSMPSVHGRTTTTASNSDNANGMPPKIRLSTHQRNLSLDFRSMGILLPPVSQVTNTRINLTQHHRNRSLDSALQRIPEVEVSSPSAETETTFCTNSILGSTMCSKIVTSSSTNPQNTPKNRAPTISTIDTCRTQNCVQNVEQEGTSALPKSSDNKKREDLTSLGSDDSGIICGSESDQVSLNRIRQSHESLDSGEIDAEEECIEILETTSMDEEYRMLQSDLCFYQTPEKDLCAIKNRRRATDDPTGDESENDVETPTAAPSQEYTSDNQNTLKKKKNKKESKIFIPIEDDGDSKKNTAGSTDVTPTPMDENVSKSVESQAASKATTPTTAPSSKPEIEPKPEHIKNEILFKNFFGATKNAIFRTAQSIIENHEKKNAAKNKADDAAAANSNSQSSNQATSSSATTPTDMKSPTEVSRKKEFFILKPSSSKNKQANPTPPAETPTETEVKPMTKSISGTSLNKLRVPGVVKCFIKEKEQSQQQVKIEKGPSGLLRFFESPVFNIHFAIHYLFYSKEPGVLSFIGNKIFSFPDQEVDLYIPQLIVMYIQMDELAEVLDPYLTHRCRRSVDFSLKCLWLLEAYNYQIDTLSTHKKNHMSLMKELYNKKERKQQQQQQPIQHQHLNPPQKPIENEILSPIKKTHHRSQSDATGLLNDSKRYASSGTLSLSSKIFPSTPAKLSLGDLSSGRAFDNGCTCFESVRGTVNDLLGQKTVCYCNAPKMAPQKEFMKALINIGKNLTSLQTKAEKTSALRMFLNLINKNLPARVWLPLHSDIPHHVVRITEEKTAVLNSKDKTPYIIYVEVVEVSDIYSSPVILKLMPTLRHTKSEEHLDSKDKNAAGTTSNSNSSSNLSAKDSGADCNSNCTKDSTSISEAGTRNDLNELHFTEDDVWSQEDDEITAQYLNLHKLSERDAISQMSLDSCDSRDQGIPTLFNIGDVRTRHCYNLNCENTKPFSNDPEDPSAAALKEPWHEKEKQIRLSSPYGHLSSWRLLSAIVKCGDDLRQELMATQLLQMFKIIWQEESVDLWVRPYKIVCLSNDSGLIEPILNTVSLHQIKKNSNKSLRDYFVDEYGNLDTTEFKTAQRNFMQSCAAYCLISYLLQVKDRHNGNILLHSDGHLIHIDFGFILSISPKNLGFEQSPFKLTPEFVEVMGGTNSELWTEFNHLLLKGLMAARKHMDRIINLVEIMRSNAQLPCFKNGCSGTVQNLRKRFHMNLTEQELERKVEQLVQDSLKSLSTKLYDGYQYFTNGIL